MLEKDNYATETAPNQAKDKKRVTSRMRDSIKRIIKVVGFIIIPVGILLFLYQRSVDGTTFLSDALVNTVARVDRHDSEGLVLLTSISFILVGRLTGKQALVQEMEAIEGLPG